MMVVVMVVMVAVVVAAALIVPALYLRVVAALRRGAVVHWLQRPVRATPVISLRSGRRSACVYIASIIIIIAILPPPSLVEWAISLSRATVVEESTAIDHDAGSINSRRR